MILPHSSAPAGNALCVTVAVLTYHRPDDLARTLPLLLAQVDALDADDRYRAELLVVDNDPEGSGRHTVEQVASPRLRYVVEPEPGISAARNRALAQANSDVLVFLDDDLRPEPGWLTGLLDVRERFGAAAVSGRVVSEFDGAVDPWISVGSFYGRGYRAGVPSGAAIEHAATNSLLLDLHVVRALGLRFDPAFGLSGGEDSLFTRTLTVAGHRLVWARDAVAIERVPAERATRQALLRKAFSHGNTEPRVALALAAPDDVLRVRLRFLAAGSARVAVGAARFAVGRVVASLGLRTRGARWEGDGARLAARGAGMAGGALGWVYQEYQRTSARHGSGLASARRMRGDFARGLAGALPLGLRRRLFYLRYHRRWPNLRHPRKFSEKINWRILHDRRPLLEWTCDKIRMKDFARASGADLVVPRTLWTGVDLTELTALDLPAQWVLKPNHRSGPIHFGQGQVTDPQALAMLTRGWLACPEFDYLGEWAYGCAAPVLLLEERIGAGTGGAAAQVPADYKLFVFDGQVRYLSVDTARFTGHRRRFYSPDWTPLTVRTTVPLAPVQPPPAQLDRMIEAARVLGADFDFVRVDVYVTHTCVYFGEVTTYSGSGLERFRDRWFDRELGDHWQLPAGVGPRR